jgi:hypothetical protein
MEGQVRSGEWQEVVLLACPSTHLHGLRERPLGWAGRLADALCFWISDLPFVFGYRRWRVSGTESGYRALFHHASMLFTILYPMWRRMKRGMLTGCVYPVKTTSTDRLRPSGVIVGLLDLCLLWPASLVEPENRGGCRQLDRGRRVGFAPRSNTSCVCAGLDLAIVLILSCLTSALPLPGKVALGSGQTPWLGSPRSRPRPQLLLLQVVSLGQHCHCGVDGSVTSQLAALLWHGCISALLLTHPSLVYVIRETGVGLVLCLMARVGVVWLWLLLLLLLLLLLCLLCFALLGDMQLPSHCLALCLLRPASSWFVLNLFWAGSVRVR